MTARELVIAGRRYTVDGEGYSTNGQDPARRGRAGHPARAVPAADGARERRGGARRRDRRRPDRGRADRARGEGRASTSTRRGARIPRVGEVPFDSEYKFMATFHEIEDDGRHRSSAASSRARRTCCSRARARDPRRRRRPCAAVEDASRACARRERPAGGRGAAGAGGRRAGLRPGDLRRRPARSSTRSSDLTLLALVGIVDPPRARGEGRDRALQGGRHPRPDDHRRPRDDRRGDRGAARHRRPRADRHRVRGA